MTSPSGAILNAFVKLSLGGRGTTTYLTVLVAITICGGGGGSGSGYGGGTSAVTTTFRVTLDATLTGTFGMIKSALNVQVLTIRSGGWPSSRKGRFCGDPEVPITERLVKTSKVVSE